MRVGVSKEIKQELLDAPPEDEVLDSLGDDDIQLLFVAMQQDMQ